MARSGLEGAIGSIVLDSTDGVPRLSSSTEAYENDGLSAGRLMDEPQWIHSKKMGGYSSNMRAMEFSDDGSMLIAGGDSEEVLIWKRDQLLDVSEAQPVPIVLKVPEKIITSLAIRLDNGLIYVGGQNLHIYDVETYYRYLKLLNGDRINRDLFPYIFQVSTDSFISLPRRW